MTVRSGRRPGSAIPVTLLTGFLGAGKTTLLNDLVREGALARTVVLINEFGEIGLDHLLVERIDGDMLLLASGCLCCTIRGDLVTALETLLRRLDNGRIAAFDRLVIETTGLADPTPILQTLLGHPYLALRFAVARIVTVVDAATGAATLARHREAVRQVAVADRIVISKTDLPNADTAGLIARLDTLAPRARKLLRARGEATADLVLGEVGDSAFVLPEIEADDTSHAHAHHHTHDRNRHDDSIRAVALVRASPIAPTALTLFLDLLRHAHGPKLLRLKGLVALADDPARPLVVHAVQHLLHAPERLAEWPDDDHRTRIVAIVDGLAPSFVEDLFAAACGEIAPDRADAATLVANPLAPVAAAGLFR